MWFRRDLRLTDNPAWAEATQIADEVVALYVMDPKLFDPAGPFRRRLLLAHLTALDRQLAARGGRLRVEVGDPAEVVPSIVAATGAETVHANADATPYSRRRDTRVHRALGGTPLRTQWGTMVHHPGAVRTAKGALPMIFTPFYRAWSAAPWAPWPEPGEARVATEPGHGVPGAPSDLSAGGEEAAWDRLEEFLGRVDAYPDERDLPGLDTTSKLAADLRWGTISPRLVCSAVGDRTEGRRAFVRQLAWRDWYAHLLWERPDLRRRALRPEWDRIAWRDDPDGLAAWREGRTGYPIVDAGMRQLAATGWMHNRVRMITASFLVKDLLIDWRQGERWFFHLLGDGDVAQNVGNWQWVAGTGPDAAPYFRIFNPVTQARRFDPDGTYVRRWCPELASLPDRWIHAPWEAPTAVLAEAGVQLGRDYPEPIVDHAEARARALEAYGKVR
jgi:deoxyribodipyrimidine photo-lyase